MLTVLLGSLPFEGQGDARGPTGDIIDRNSAHRKEKQLALHLAMASWKVARYETGKPRLPAFQL